MSNFFFIMNLPPPRSTLFPYTTLFRSLRNCRHPSLAAAHGRETLRGARRRPGPGGGCRPDRKSTRLNSSHSQISYAVFCLKKKRSQIFTSKICTHYYYIPMVFSLPLL